MENRVNKRKIAWITVPAFISTDRFIVPELSKYYDIDWYLIQKNNEKIDFLDSITSLSNEFGFVLEIEKINFRNSDIRTAGAYRKFLNKIKDRNYDLVYSVMIGIPYYMPLLRLIIGNKKTLIAIHNVHVPKGGSMYLPSIVYTRFSIASFKFFQTFSASQKKELLKIAPNKYCDNVNFVLMDYGTPSLLRKDGTITFLSFGIIRQYKRIDVLINAAQTAYEKTGIEFKVIIAGGCDNWSDYQDLIKYPKLFDLRIKRIEDKDVPNMFAECDYFVAPYQDIAQSGSAIIAVNYNVPIIASRLEAFENYIEDGKTGFLIDPASYDQLVEKMVYVLQNHSRYYVDMRAQIEHEKNAKFSAESVAKLYMKNFDACLDNYR